MSVMSLTQTYGGIEKESKKQLKNTNRNSIDICNG